MTPVAIWGVLPQRMRGMGSAMMGLMLEEISKIGETIQEIDAPEWEIYMHSGPIKKTRGFAVPKFPIHVGWYKRYYEQEVKVWVE